MVIVKDYCETEHYFVGATVDDRYHLTDFIGAGGMACVYRAQETGSPHEYALKFLKAEYHNLDYLIEYFRDEASSMRDLAHPNIVRFYRFVNTPEYSYIIMDYVDGFALSDVIKLMYEKKEFIPLDEVVRVMTQVARALDAIHREGYVHRDIKPSNVLIDRKTGQAFLTDLGITSASNTRMEGAGTLAYMSPEQAETWVADRRSDIYAYGIMLFEMLAMRRPFRVTKGLSGSEAEADLLRKHQEAPIPDVTQHRRGLPDALNGVIAKALAKDPDARYQNIIEFARDVHEVLRPQLGEDLQDFTQIQHRQIEAPDRNGMRTSQPANGRGVLLGIGLIVILLAALIAGSTFLRSGVPVMTHTPSPSATNTAPPTLTPTPNPLIGEALYTLLQDGAAFAELNTDEGLVIPPAEDGALQFLRVGFVDGFRVELTTASVTGSGQIGVAFRVQDSHNYQVFVLNPESGDWQFATVRDGATNIERSGTLTSIGSSLVVSGLGDYYQAQVGDAVLELVSDTYATGSLALYVNLDNGRWELTSLAVILVGDEAQQAAEAMPTPAPGVGDPLRFLRADVTALLATNDVINSEINCPRYITVYERLDRHVDSPDATVRDVAQDVISTGEVIYSRCRSESPDATLSFVSALQDYVEWERNLRALQERIAGT